MPKKSILELEKSPKKWTFKSKLKTIDELQRSKPTGGGAIAGEGEEKAQPSKLRNVPDRLRKFSTHQNQSKVENLDYSKKKKVEEWLKNKEDLDLSFYDLERKVKEELDEDISRESLRRHLKWLEKQESETIAITS